MRNVFFLQCPNYILILPDDNENHVQSKKITNVAERWQRIKTDNPIEPDHSKVTTYTLNIFGNKSKWKQR